MERFESVDWRVDFVLSSSSLQEINQPSVQLNLNVQNLSKKNTPSSIESHAFGVDADKFRILLHELKAAKEVMKTL